MEKRMCYLLAAREFFNTTLLYCQWGSWVIPMPGVAGLQYPEFKFLLAHTGHQHKLYGHHGLSGLSPLGPLALSLPPAAMDPAPQSSLA